MLDMVIPISSIYVPIKRRRTLDEIVVQEIAESVAEEGLKVPILVRIDGDRYVLIEGLHRLEACRALGEETIIANTVNARLR